MRPIHAFAAALIALAAPAGALAEGKGGPPSGQAKGGAQGQAKGSGKPDPDVRRGHDADAGDAVEAAAEAAFTEAQRRLIHEFFGAAYHGGGGGLPPGLRKQLTERGTLPPGLARKPLPPGLAKKLGPAPAGYRRLIVDDDVLLIRTATDIVVDAVLDVARPG